MNNDDKQRRMSEVMERLRQSYGAKLGDKGDEVEQVLRAWQSGEAGADEQMARMLHTLAGTAGSFGFDEISDRGAEILVRMRDGDGLAAVQPDIEAFIALLRAQG